MSKRQSIVHGKCLLTWCKTEFKEARDVVLVIFVE